MSDLVVLSVANSPLVSDAKRGLMGELSMKSRKAYEPIVDNFLSFLGNYLLDHPTSTPAVVLSEYLRTRKDMGLAPRTLNKIRSVLRRFLEWTMRVGLTPAEEYASVLKVKGVKVQGRRGGRWLSEEALQCMVDAPDASTLIGRRDRAILALLIGTALRRFEIVSLTWEQFEKRPDGWVIRNLERKHNRTQEVLGVPDWTMKALLAYSQPGNPNDHVIVSIGKGGTRGHSITPQKVYTVVRDYSERCGFKVAPHDLRRSWALIALQKGIDINQISLQLGHASVATTAIYLKQDLNVSAVNKAFTLDI